MGLAMAISVETKAAAILVFTGVIAPAIGLGLKRVGGGWDSLGGGRFAILEEEPAREGGAPPRVDPAIQEAEVRQFVVARNERRRRQGLEPLDVEAETACRLAGLGG